MKKTIRFAPPHSIFAIADPTARDIPEGADLPVRIWVTRDMIGVACTNSDDSDTELTVSASQADVPINEPRADVQLPTPSRRIDIEQSDLKQILSIDVAEPTTRVRIWSNDPKYPDKILIVFG